jgi:Fe-coproporphyrin III synthase
MNELSYGLHQKIIQIHPTLACNLFCDHCYSNSGPNAIKLKLNPSVLIQVIDDAHEMGYEVASFSGGEPLMYEGLDRVIRHAKSCGMTTTVTSNGTLSNLETLRKLRGYLDLMAISLDGPPQIHNELRKSAIAFEYMTAGLENVRNVGLKFGFIHTLTKRSWDQLLWIAEFCAQNRASLLQIHPLELIGRARDTGASSIAPDDDILARVYLLTLALATKYSTSMTIQFDVFHRQYILQYPELVYASTNQDISSVDEIKPADLLRIIVVEADGSVVPISSGFSKQYKICNIKTQRLSESWSQYMKQGGYLAFIKLCKKVLKEIALPALLPFFNWYELITTRSYSPI